MNMNFSSKMAEFGTKIKTASDNTKKQAEAMRAKAGEAIASATAKKEVESEDAPIPTEVEATTAVPSTITPTASEENSPAKKISVGEKLTEFTSQFKIAPKDDEPVSDLLEVLSTLFEVDPKAKKPHEMVEALELQGIKTWRGFLLMAEEDIPQLTKNSRDGEISISNNAIRMLTYLKQFTLYNINSGVENAKDPSIYTREAFDAYVDDLQLGRKSAFSKEDEADKKSNKERLDNMRASITGFASKLQPGFAKNEEGSINDILQKAKTKVFSRNKDSKDAASITDDASVGAVSAGSTEMVAHNDSAFESMRKSVDDLASKLETTAKTAKTKEEVQKLMVPLLSKLKVSQDKFAHMIEARKKKKEDSGEEVEGEEGEETPAADEAAANGDSNNQKFKNLLSSAENATKRAFENAEKVARQAAKKAGILDSEEKKEEETEGAVPAQNGCQAEETV